MTVLPSSFASAAQPPARIVYGSIQHHGLVTELRFTVRGRAPRLELRTHASELWVDLANTRIEIPPRPFFGRETPPVAMVRALNRGGGARSRIVIEVSGKVDYAIARLAHEILVRLAPAGKVPNLAAPILLAGREQSPPRPDVAPARPRRHTHPAPNIRYGTRAPATLARAGPALVRPKAPAISRAVTPLAGNPLVMIDPGHGGYDPGAHSASGLEEKTLALEIARRVSNALEARGVRAVLTRTADRYLSLPERTGLANEAHAKLFVSIHLNWSPDPGTTGLEVFYLNNTTDRATIRLARMENQGIANGYGPVSDAGLNYILADLRQNYKATESAALARMIDAQTVADLDAQPGINVQALGAKKGPFYVLVGANMPAVLIECGFLSNRYEAASLASARYQQILADGIAQAIVHYLSADAAVGNL